MLKKSYIFFIVSAVLGFSCKSMHLDSLDANSPLRAQYFADRANFDALQDQWAAELLHEDEPVKEENALEHVINALDNDQFISKEEAQPEKLTSRPKLSIIPYAEDVIEKVVPSLKYLATKTIVDNKIDSSFEMPNDTKTFIAMCKLIKEANQEVPQEFMYQGTISNKFFNRKVVSETKPDMSPLMLAMKRDDPSAFESLVLDPAVDPNSADAYDGVTPLIWAAHEGSDYYVSLLLSNPKIDLEKKDYFGRDALKHATQEGHTAIIQKLLNRNAETTTKDVANKSVYDFAPNDGILLTLACESSKNIAGDVQTRLLLLQDMYEPVSIEFVVEEK